MQKANRPCREPGCVRYALKGESFCQEHFIPRGRSKHAKDWRKEYGTARWARARCAYLQAHPLCVECEKAGRLVTATVVDHVIPHRGDMKLFWDQKNWQALCKSCHDRKTAAEDGGFGNERVRTPEGEGGQISGALDI